MKYLLGFAVLLVLGCGGPDNGGPSGIDLSAMDQTVDPCADFYKYACGGWINNHPIGADGSYTSKYIAPYYEALPRLRQIIEDDAAGVKSPDDPHGALTGAYYQSCLDAPANTSARQELAALLAKID